MATTTTELRERGIYTIPGYGDGIELIACEGDEGGWVLYDRKEWDAEAQAGIEVVSPEDKAAIQVAARRAKEALSDAEATQVTATLGGREVAFDVTRAQFEAATADLTARTLAAAAPGASVEVRVPPFVAVLTLVPAAPLV